MSQILLQGGRSEPFLCAREGHAQVLCSQHGGQTLVLQVSPDRADWVDSDITFEDIGVKRFGIVKNWYYRMGGDDVRGATVWIGREDD